MDQESWEESYRNQQAPWRTDGDISDLLKSADVSGGKALDLGCGTGEIAIFLADRNFEVEAIDFSMEALRIAKERSEKPLFVQWDLENLQSYPFRSEKYDLIIDNKVIAFIKDKERYLKSIAARLRGVFIVRCLLEHKKKPSIAVSRVELEDLLARHFIIAKKNAFQKPDKIFADYFLVNKQIDREY